MRILNPIREKTESSRMFPYAQHIARHFLLSFLLSVRRNFQKNKELLERFVRHQFKEYFFIDFIELSRSMTHQHISQ